MSFTNSICVCRVQPPTGKVNVDAGGQHVVTLEVRAVVLSFALAHLDAKVTSNQVGGRLEWEFSVESKNIDFWIAFTAKDGEEETTWMESNRYASTDGLIKVRFRLIGFSICSRGCYLGDAHVGGGGHGGADVEQLF